MTREANHDVRAVYRDPLAAAEGHAPGPTGPIQDDETTDPLRAAREEILAVATRLLARRAAR